MCVGDEFRNRVDVLMTQALHKGVPPLFNNLRLLYRNRDKVQCIQHCVRSWCNKIWMSIISVSPRYIWVPKSIGAKGSFEHFWSLEQICWLLHLTGKLWLLTRPDLNPLSRTVALICRRHVCVCVCVCVTHSVIVSEWLNVGLRK